MAQEEKWLYPLIIDYQRRKVCECERPRTFILDTVNKLVYCKECGAIVDPYEALLEFGTDSERIQRAVDAWAQEAEKEKRKCLRYRGVNNISEEYRHGMVPICPACGIPIDPAHLSTYVSKAYLKDSEDDKHE